MAKEIIATPPGVFDAATKGWKYSNAVKAGNTVYLAGQVALDVEGNVVGKGDYEAQLRQILENIKRILEAAGSKMTDIVWIQWLCKDIRQGLLNRSFPVYEEYFGDYHPPGTLIQVSGLGDPDLMIEVQVIAVIDE